MRISLILLVAVMMPATLPALGRSETPSDEEIKRQVVNQLTWNDAVNASQITVQVNGGDVVLSGAVPSLTSRRRATNEAWSVDGVLSVTNRLEVTTPEPALQQTTIRDLESRIANLLDWSTSVNIESLSVRAVGGTVTLEGVTDSVFEKRRAGEMAMDFAGVTEVANNVEVVPGNAPLDTEIAADVLQAIDRSPLVSENDVDVAVSEGVVRLTGSVPSIAAKNAAGRAAELTFGVVDVNNDLVVQSFREAGRTDREIRTDVIAELTWDPRIDASKIAVQVQDGQVTLEGTVTDLQNRRTVEQAAESVAGVTEVVNLLEIEPEPIGSIDVTSTVRTVVNSRTELVDDEIRISAVEGIVTLRGTVDSLWEKTRAEEAAHEAALYTAGVQEIDNNIRVRAAAEGA